MAHPNFELAGGDTFTFSNEHVTIAVETGIVPPDSITVKSVTFTTPHDTFTLPITDFVVPPPCSRACLRASDALRGVRPERHAFSGGHPHGPSDER
jgi:hypothetical protein